ncbi:MAG: hypothetical protein RR554_04055 [Vagococcus sp.]|uniref:hypothetical protein n=1 Tax=Vagococcus sp. TaxID=1933889 RepID=UPI002FC5BF46
MAKKLLLDDLLGALDTKYFNVDKILLNDVTIDDDNCSFIINNLSDSFKDDLKAITDRPAEGLSVLFYYLINF